MNPKSVFSTTSCSVLLALAATVLIGCGGGSGRDNPSSSSSSASGSAVAHLSVSGQNLVDSSGKAVMLRGWNWGRWGLAQSNDAADNAQQGANSVRIPLRWWGYYEGPDIDSRDDAQTATAGIDANHLAILDAMIAQASAAHLWIVLFIDSDCGQNGTQDANEVAYCDPGGNYPNGHNFWTDPVAREKFIEVWKFIAARYKNTPYLGMFEPLPEPNPVSASDRDITTFYDEVMTAIRSVAPGVPFLIGARTYNIKQAGAAYNANWTDVVYTGNMFLYTSGTQTENIDNLTTRLQYLLDLRSSFNVPTFVQQAGVQSGDDPDQTYLNALLSLLNASDVGYTYWEYRDTFNPNAYGVIYQDGNGGWITKTNFLDTIIGYFKR